MKVGGGKGKGSEFERIICKQLSLWITHGAKRDCFWRSAMSGGRATIAHGKGIDLRRQAGDISSVSPEGHALTDLFFVETKFYRSLDLGSFPLGKGALAGFWKVAVKEARKYDRSPMVIAKENLRPIVVLVKPGALSKISTVKPFCRVYGKPACDAYLFDLLIRSPFRASIALTSEDEKL